MPALPVLLCSTPVETAEIHPSDRPVLQPPPDPEPARVPHVRDPTTSSEKREIRVAPPHRLVGLSYLRLLFPSFERWSSRR